MLDNHADSAEVAVVPFDLESKLRHFMLQRAVSHAVDSTNERHSASQGTSTPPFQRVTLCRWNEMSPATLARRPGLVADPAENQSAGGR